jgi:hypothetical protein
VRRQDARYSRKAVQRIIFIKHRIIPNPASVHAAIERLAAALAARTGGTPIP